MQACVGPSGIISSQQHQCLWQKEEQDLLLVRATHSGVKSVHRSVEANNIKGVTPLTYSCQSKGKCEDRRRTTVLRRGLPIPTPASDRHEDRTAPSSKNRTAKSSSALLLG